MGSIFGCVLHRTVKEGAAKTIHQGLKKLEYKSYDSIGIATVSDFRLHVKKGRGRIEDVHAALNLDDLPGLTGIGHTRWATHGAPNKYNAHPQVDCKSNVAVAHNGIIKNYFELKRELEGKGHTFTSKTDTEVISHLVEEGLKQGSPLQNAVREALMKVEGTYALAVICSSQDRNIVAASKLSPLTIGAARDGFYLSSDVSALLPFTNRVTEVQSQEVALLSDDGVEIRRLKDWSQVERQPKTVEWNVETAQREGHPHFILKEIYEQPQALNNALLLQDRYLELLATFLDRSTEIYLLASGSSYNACVAASYMFSKLACLPAYPVIASEFVQHYGDAVNIESTVFAVSQSGETPEVIQALDHARYRAATILGLTNVIGSTLTRIARAYISQQSGPEIGVPTMKTFTAQVFVLAQISLRLAKLRGKISQDEIDSMEESLREAPLLVDRIIKEHSKSIREIARGYRDSRLFFFLSRGVNYATALEGALKLLEMGRTPSIAYPAGESKHGPISLVEPGFTCVFVAPRDETHKLIVGNMREMQSRGARILAVMEEGDEEAAKIANDTITLPKVSPSILTPLIFIIPLQLLAYYTALEKGLDPDGSANLQGRSSQFNVYT